MARHKKQLDQIENDVELPESGGQAQRDEMRRSIEALASSLLKKRDAAIQFKTASGVERRWMEDEASFDGMDALQSGRKRMLDYATGTAPSINTNEPHRSKIVANIARSKCETAWGRFADILLPVDSKNWGLKSTPVPELSSKLYDQRPAAVASTNEPINNPDGSHVPIADIARSEMDDIKKRMAAMESEIDDQLNECSYNGECRKVIWDAIKIGTGILKGPNVVKRIKKTWSKQEDPNGDSAYTVTMVEEFKPELRRVDPWNVFPDPDCGEDIQRAGYVWERDTILPRELSSLAGMDGYFDDQIKLVLAEEAKKTIVTNTKQQSQISQVMLGRGANYERWEYNGDIDRDDLEAMGCDCSHDEISPSLSACVVFVNDRAIKVVLNMLDTGDMPYSFFQWTSMSGSIWGIGIPRMQYWWDRVLTAAWRAMMDNAGDSAGANVVIGDGITPADGRMELTGKKVWYANSEVEDVRAAVFQWQINNNQDQLQKVIELALRFIDMETSLPMLFQGEKAEAPETLGATNIMVDANNVALRGRVKRWDDEITRPALTRMYYWNMQYNDKEDIKGDYNVDAVGASVLLAKDNQTAALINAFKLKADPDVSTVIDWPKAIRMFFANQGLDVVKDEEEIKQVQANMQQAAQQGGQQDPRIAGQMQIAQMRSQGEMQKAQLTQQSDMKELELKREIETANIQFKADQAALDRQLQLQLKQMEREIKMMELSQSSQQSIESIKAQLSETAMKLNVQKELSKPPVVTPETSMPPTEPSQQAPTGRAYQE